MFDIETGKYLREFNLDKGDTSENVQLYNKTRFFSLDIANGDKEILLGCSKLKDGGFAQIYDLETETVKSSTFCHKEDVNSACYLDKSSSNVFLTASDDGTAKLWDERILKNNAPVGTFYGHVSGLTCVSSKDDNRYFITNSKDQSLKLWDIRKYSTMKKNHHFLKYDYRCEVLTPDHIQDIKEKQKKLDDSLMTFWGHQVHLTLIRCRFSPLHGTGQRYIYTGSFDGRVYIYDTITGENVITLELPKENDSIFNCPVVRDCAWHPYSQSLINTSFRGGVCRWEYSDLRDAERLEEEESQVEEEEEEEDVVICYRNDGSMHSVSGNRYNY
jgi:WD repeat-containing protein 23